MHGLFIYNCLTDDTHYSSFIMRMAFLLSDDRMDGNTTDSLGAGRHMDDKPNRSSEMLSWQCLFTSPE